MPRQTGNSVGHQPYVEQLGAGGQLHVRQSRQRRERDAFSIARIAPQTTACAAGGSGAMAMYVNGAWSCAGAAEAEVILFATT